MGVVGTSEEGQSGANRDDANLEHKCVLHGACGTMGVCRMHDTHGAACTIRRQISTASAPRRRGRERADLEIRRGFDRSFHGT